jgi:thiol-disulfide isomerase/thioredoxin
MARARAGLLLALFLAPVDVPAVEVGQVAPELTIPSLDPPHVISLSDYRGRVVYLDFWSSWCAPCRRTMPELSALRDRLPRDDFEVVAVNVDPANDDARRFLAQVPVSYPVGLDATARSATAFGVATLPAAFLIDREGIVQHVYRGDADVRAICEHVRRLANGSPQSHATTIASEHGPCVAPRASSREGSSRS